MPTIEPIWVSPKTGKRTPISLMDNEWLLNCHKLMKSYSIEGIPDYNEYLQWKSDSGNMPDYLIDKNEKYEQLKTRVTPEFVSMWLTRFEAEIKKRKLRPKAGAGKTYIDKRQTMRTRERDNAYNRGLIR
jgi:tmRNA-binding protein